MGKKANVPMPIDNRRLQSDARNPDFLLASSSGARYKKLKRENQTLFTQTQEASEDLLGIHA